MKTQHVVLVLSAVAVAYVGLAVRTGSSSPVPEAQAETSGTRLKAVVTTGSDGSKLFDAELLHDTTLDVDCKFVRATDGQKRCLPYGDDVFTDGAQFRYTDDKCTKPMAYLPGVPGGCPPVVPKYVITTDYVPYCGATDDEVKRHVYETGALLGNVGQVYNINPQGDCVGAGGGTGVPYELSTELPASSFVAGTAGID